MIVGSAEHIYWLVTKDPVNHNNADCFEKTVLKAKEQLDDVHRKLLATEIPHG